MLTALSLSSYQMSTTKDSKSGPASASEARAAERLNSVGQRLASFSQFVRSRVDSVSSVGAGKSGSGGSGGGGGAGVAGGGLPWDQNAYASNLLVLDAGTRKITNQRLLVTVVALIKSGKSTLTNASVGGNLLHDSNEPATSCVAHVRHSASGQYTLYQGKVNDSHTSGTGGGSGRGSGSGGSGGGGMDLSRSIEEGDVLASGKHKIYPRVKQLNNDIRSGKISHSNGHVILRAPLVCLNGLSDVLTSRFEWVDTPGRNEARGLNGPEMGAVVDSLLATTDVIVFMFNYASLGSNDEKLMWEQMYESRPDLLRANSHRIFYIINKFDQQTATSLTADQTIDYICKQVKTFVGYTPDRIRMYFTNARHSLMARRMMASDIAVGSDEEADYLKSFFPVQKNKSMNDLKSIDWQTVLDESGVPAVEKQVFRYLTEPSISFMVDAAEEDLSRYVQSI